MKLQIKINEYNEYPFGSVILPCKINAPSTIDHINPAKLASPNNIPTAQFTKPAIILYISELPNNTANGQFSIHTAIATKIPPDINNNCAIASLFLPRTKLPTPPTPAKHKNCNPPVKSLLNLL